MTIPRVPASNVAAQYHRLKDEIDAALRVVFDEGRFEMGREVYEFEAAFARYTGTQHAVSVHSGTAALHLSLRALGLGPGDEVITVANPDISTTAAVHMAGARLVLADIDAGTFNIDPDRMAAAVTPRTRALLPVDMYGQSADMAAVMDLARRHDLWVVEDAALAVGAEFEGSKAGSTGHTGCFSFAPSKVLGAVGWGGMVTTDDAELARKLRMLRAYGEDPDQRPPASGGYRHQGLLHEVEGWNVRMDTIQAAALLVKLPHLETFIAERRQIAALYREALAGLPVTLPFEDPRGRHVYRNFVIRLPAGIDRDAVRAALWERGVATGTNYVPLLHLQPVYAGLGYGEGSLPVTEAVARDLLCLPVYPEMPPAHVEIVAEALRSVLGGRVDQTEDGERL